MTLLKNNSIHFESLINSTNLLLRNILKIDIKTALSFPATLFPCVPSPAWVTHQPQSLGFWLPTGHRPFRDVPPPSVWSIPFQECISSSISSEVWLPAVSSAAVPLAPRCCHLFSKRCLGRSTVCSPGWQKFWQAPVTHMAFGTDWNQLWQPQGGSWPPPTQVALQSPATQTLRFMPITVPYQIKLEALVPNDIWA